MMSDSTYSKHLDVVTLFPNDYISRGWCSSPSLAGLSLSPTGRSQGGFQVLGIMNRAARNIHVQAFVWTQVVNANSKDCDYWVVW